ncbi:hypothetical protein [Telmatospirillum siberiense]|uniref:Uncharacterized protein n=1 Tax=Telmatospirillum siberiense TaxID=382514 RepID=A0A2N3PLU2_9PROT|nr:hypothetical protein [Telmatospirillum siberiense]PKU21365.1 hypothetical protein CWS72_27080 [Telmatospirillum siberiense]
MALIDTSGISNAWTDFQNTVQGYKNGTNTAGDVAVKAATLASAVSSSIDYTNSAISAADKVLGLATSAANLNSDIKDYKNATALDDQTAQNNAIASMIADGATFTGKASGILGLIGGPAAFEALEPIGLAADGVALTANAWLLANKVGQSLADYLSAVETAIKQGVIDESTEWGSLSPISFNLPDPSGRWGLSTNVYGNISGANIDPTSPNFGTKVFIVPQEDDQGNTIWSTTTIAPTSTGFSIEGIGSDGVTYDLTGASSASFTSSGNILVSTSGGSAFSIDRVTGYISGQNAVAGTIGDNIVKIITPQSGDPFAVQSAASSTSSDTVLSVVPVTIVSRANGLTEVDLSGTGTGVVLDANNTQVGTAQVYSGYSIGTLTAGGGYITTTGGAAYSFASGMSPVINADGTVSVSSSLGTLSITPSSGAGTFAAAGGTTVALDGTQAVDLTAAGLRVGGLSVNADGSGTLAAGGASLSFGAGSSLRLSDGGAVVTSADGTNAASVTSDGGLSVDGVTVAADGTGLIAITTPAGAVDGTTLTTLIDGDGHIVDQALPQRADGRRGHWGLLSWGVRNCTTSFSRQEISRRYRPLVLVGGVVQLGCAQPEAKRTSACRSQRRQRSEGFVTRTNRAFRTLTPVFVTLFCITVGSIDVVAAETDGLGQWTGLWCSGRDEIGVNTHADLGSHADGQTAPLYLYVRLYLGDANSYTVEGPATPLGDGLELTDGECQIRAERRGTQMIVTDNHRCDKISAAFQHREFNRIKQHIVFGHSWRSKQHCSETTSDQ